ncbi:MAG TPA: hypothetical protein VEL31_04530 [Ktedonobacteraceae bacterium]|nr:hypothetical protein [Ktedonobacteraceae bacterium]
MSEVVKRRRRTAGWWGKPSHVARLRWWMGWYGGSRGKVRRMRAEPVVPVEAGRGGGEGTAGTSSQE